MPRSPKAAIDNLQKYFLLGSLLLLMVLLFAFLRSFLTTLFIAAIIATGIHPLYKLMITRGKMNRTLSTLIILFAVVFILNSVITWFLSSVVGEATAAYGSFRTNIEQYLSAESAFAAISQRFPSIYESLSNMLEQSPFNLQEIVIQGSRAIGDMSSFLLGQATNVVKQVSTFLLHLVIFVLSLFYFIRDGENIARYIQSLLPMSKHYRTELFEKIRILMNAIIYGIFGTAIVQGALVGIGLAIVGVENAAFWGALAVLLAPLPYIGTTLIWFPVVILLFIQGEPLWAIFLLIWGMIIVGTADNIIKPYIIGSGSALHPLAVMLVVFGGVFSFGFEGLIFGPFVLTLTLAFVHIYSIEYREVLNEKKRT